jgi:hypothetical protein
MRGEAASDVRGTRPIEEDVELILQMADYGTPVNPIAHTQRQKRTVACRRARRFPLARST